MQLALKTNVSNKTEIGIHTSNYAWSIIEQQFWCGLHSVRTRQIIVHLSATLSHAPPLLHVEHFKSNKIKVGPTDQ